MLHPYRSLPGTAFWDKAVAKVPPSDLDPTGPGSFRLERSDRIATAGSCFAQHIARYLQQSGYRSLLTEPAHPLLTPDIAKEFNYNLYTARYGNIYTSAQLLQLLERSYELRLPDEDIWYDGLAYYDPFRPAVQPGGFATRSEYLLDRERHFHAVREAIETMDCLVFTLGLTECWRARSDLSVYPVCPGVSAGIYAEDKYEFHNLSVQEVTSDLDNIVAFIRKRNPSAKLILTVSPVPLVASMSQKHVLTATTYSKSVLRVAAQDVADCHEGVDYFPSYEIITGHYSRGAYFDDDLRSVSDTGVQHVMRVFFRHYGLVAQLISQPLSEPAASIDYLAKLVCEEEALQSFSRR